MMLCRPSCVAPAPHPRGGSLEPGLHHAARLKLLLLLPVLLPVLHGCTAGTDEPVESRTLATIDAALEETDLPAQLLAQQHRLFEILAENRADELSQYLDLSFRFNDMENPAPRAATASVGSGYLPAWIQPAGLNYYQFLAAGVPAHEWAGRTLEIVWSFSGVALIVAHQEERNPVFTQWERREDGWKVVRMTINASDESLQEARESRRVNR